ncbi:hypothetical protein GCM10017771_81260 [Streptomyces capitiformicae]|uniref:Uncharacterized protein n=1 Tax=Streptomyces capitiformicae TaxID=2014920 RepID=A0A918ZKV7_9ACTN|nr:hypothetical protein GCM10017771_81260 [Streptomyces capitiformicae]
MVVAALVRPTLRSLPWTLFAAGWGLGLAVAAVPVLFSMELSAEVLVNVVRAAALCGAVGMAFVLDDPARHTTAVPPYRVRCGRRCAWPSCGWWARRGGRWCWASSGRAPIPRKEPRCRRAG